MIWQISAPDVFLLLFIIIIIIAAIVVIIHVKVSLSLKQTNKQMESSFVVVLWHLFGLKYTWLVSRKYCSLSYNRLK